MQNQRNPFTPSFGKVPPLMAGRERILDELLESFANGPGDPNLTTIFIGARGTGKTALLTCAANEAEQAGWVSANVSARPGMLDDILLQAKKASAHLIPADEAAKLTGVQIGQLLTLEWENTPKTPGNWRLLMEDLIDVLSQKDVGLLITVDEVRADLPEMIDLVSVYQHFVREDKKVALLMAGLPFKVSELLSQEDISFLRRAQHRYLGRIPDFEIRSAFLGTVEKGGRSIDALGLDEAVRAIGGFPYMMQLVGYRSWAQHPGSSQIEESDVRVGIGLANEELRVGVFETTFRELSPKDREFLFAMTEDVAESSVADIAKRMNVKSNYAGQYKKRLLEQGLIGERGRGVVALELPGFREFLLTKKEDEESANN